jgi:hypothetical protein
MSFHILFETFGLPGFTVFLMSPGLIFATGRDHPSRLQRYGVPNQQKAAEVAKDVAMR